MTPNFVVFKLPKQTHATLKQIARHHRRKLNAQMDYLVSAEYLRLIKSGELKEELQKEGPEA